MATLRYYIHPQNYLRNLDINEVEQGLREARPALPDEAIYLGLDILGAAALDATMAHLIDTTRDAYKAELAHSY